jgi:dienelactone hydrolase
MQMMSAIIGFLLLPTVIGEPAAWIGGHYCTVFNAPAPHVIVLFHGYLGDPTLYYDVGLNLAAEGYAVVIPRDNNGLDGILPTKASDWGTSIAAAVRDWAYPRRVAIVGHSMGGAAAMAAARFTPGLTSFVAMHPAPILSGSSSVLVQGPILFTTGTTDDGNIGGATTPQAAMDAYTVALSPKALVNVGGDDHKTPQDLKGMQWSSVVAWLGCFTKQRSSDCSWISTQMCQDKTLAWCAHSGVQAVVQAATANVGIHV